MRAGTTLSCITTGLAVLTLAVGMPDSWARKTNRIGTVLAVAGDVKVQPRRTKEWKNANLVECIVSKTLQIDHTPIAMTFPTTITPISLCTSPYSTQIVSSLIEPDKSSGRQS